MTIMEYIIWFLIGFMIVASLLPLSKIPHGAVRGLAFPKEQFFGVAVALAAAVPFILKDAAIWYALAALAVIAALQLIYIVKFTPLWPRQSVDATAEERADKSNQITVIAANVKLSNRNYDRAIRLLRENPADIIAAIEVDEDWIAALRKGLGDDFEHWISVPLDNGYGLCLMSKLPLSETEVSELIVDKVPSIRTIVTLPSGRPFRLYIVHPEPPVPNQDTKGRDSEIAQIGIEAAKDPMPAIVTGDLNDVAWSTTTRRFQRLSGLLDPRVGRGFYNTFHAYMPWMRWPLDHLFHDPEFRLIRMERLPSIGSDHFPMLFSLALTPKKACETDPGTSSAEERQEVEEMIDEEKKRDREAIGSDWEDED